MSIKRASISFCINARTKHDQDVNRLDNWLVPAVAVVSSREKRKRRTVSHLPSACAVLVSFSCISEGRVNFFRNLMEIVFTLIKFSFQFSRATGWQLFLSFRVSETARNTRFRRKEKTKVAIRMKGCVVTFTASTEKNRHHYRKEIVSLAVFSCDK